MAVPTFGSAGSGVAASGVIGSSLSVGYPSGIAAGDILIVQAFAWDNTGTVSTPSGWTLITSTSGTQGGHYAFWKPAVGTESGTLTVSFTDSNAGRYARMYRFTNTGASVDNTGSAQGSSTTVADVGVTTGTANRLAVNLVAIRDNLAVGNFTGMTGGTWAEATAEFTSTTGNDAVLQVQTADMASTGTVNGGTLTTASASAPGTNDWSVIGFSLPVASSPARTIDADPGSYTITGAPVTFVYVPTDAELYAAIDFGSGFARLEDRIRSATTRRGRPFNLDRVEAGTATAVFKDGDGLLDPSNTGGEHYGHIFPLAPLTILRREGGIEYHRFTGPIERFLPHWYPPSHKDQEVQAADSFELLANTLIESDRATLTTNLSGSNNDLVFTAVEGGEPGDNITVAFVVAGNNTALGAETNDPLLGNAISFADAPALPFGALLGPAQNRIPSAVSVQGSDISVTIATDISGNPTSTAAQVKTAMEAAPEIVSLVSIAHAPGSSGAGVVTAMAATNLDGGKWPEEMSGARIERILDLAGWSASLRDIDTGSYRIVSKGYSIKENVSAIQAIQDVADSELGYVFMRGDNTFVYHENGHRNEDPRSTASRATFTNVGSSGFRYQDLQQSYDKDRIVNKATVTGGYQGSVPQMAEDTYSQTGTGTPPDGAPNVPAGGYGPREISRNTLLANDEDCLAQAESIVVAFAYPQQRIESLTTMEPASGSGWVESVLDLEIGDLITVIVKPPSTGGAATSTSYEMFVEEVADEIAPGVPWTVTLRLTPASQSVAAPPPPAEEGALLNNIGGALVLDDATNGKIG